MAEPIPVTSGAHQGFTRLVFESSGLRGWSYSKESSLYRISFPNHQDGFKTDSIYKRIQNDRVKSFQSSSSEFVFETVCECDVNFFMIGDTVLVVDVKDSPQASRNSSKTSGSDYVTEPFRYGVRGPEHSIDTSKPAFSYASKRTSLPREVGTAPSDVEVSSRLNETLQQLSLPLMETGTASQVGVLKEAKEQLRREFGAASTKGVLEKNARFSPPANDQKKPQVDLQIFDSSQVLVPEPQEQIESGQIRVTSSSDAEQINVQGNGVTTLGIECIGPGRVTVTDWTDGRSFDSQIGELRGQLFGEFDRLNTEIAVKLARTYLYFGFGAEAQSILAMMDDASGMWPELVEMAQILERGYVPNSNNLHNFSDCDSPAALWGILANPALAEGQVVNDKAALLALNALPLHLRSFLAPELSKRLLNYGDRNGAKNALRSIERTTTTHDGRSKLAKAEIDMAEGNMASAEANLKEVIESNSEFSARALISLVETETNTGQELDAETASLIEAYAMELRGSPIEAELRRAHVLALAKTDQFSSAFEALERLSDGGEKSSIRTKLFDLLNSESSDSDFLHLFFANKSKLASVTDKDQVLHAARRLQNLGFSGVAETLLADGKVPEQGNAIALLRAEIALDLGRPATADALLLLVEGREADALRARAREQKLDRVRAYEIFAELENTEAARNNAWLSDDWKSLTNVDMPVFGQMVSLANREVSNSLDPVGMLQRTQDMLSESAASRSAIEDIIQN